MNGMYFWHARLFTRNEMIKLRKLGVNANFGVSTQDTPYQQEVKAACISRTSYLGIISRRSQLCNYIEFANFRVAGLGTY
jgi:hypothetical protein